LVQAVGLRLFMVPAQLASGGISSISQLINHFTGWPIGLMVFIGNIPLFLLGWRLLGGRRFAMRTLVAVLAYSIFTEAVLRLPFFSKGGILMIWCSISSTGRWSTVSVMDWSTGRNGQAAGPTS
jgi:uncharacterized membrane-anchored protein YitT (DUF2179 family)